MNNISVQTLQTIFSEAGIPYSVADACVAGRLSRTFGNRDVTLAWKSRDAYYWLAEMSVNETEKITLTKILFIIMPELSMGEYILEGLVTNAKQVSFYTKSFKQYSWQSPVIRYGYYRELRTAIQLYYIYTIWQNNPSFRETDFSAAVKTFDDDVVARILANNKLSLPQPTIEQKKLITFLASAPRTRREIEEHMQMKRGDLLTNLLYPARKIGWITVTNSDSPSSPSQRYMLTKTGKQAIFQY
ncbi:MAG: hypothetical protein IKA22_01005 [Lentisphaeria bacterium]|nr:hypothetical protein [Lentisphaeria bacterium]